MGHLETAKEFIFRPAKAFDKNKKTSSDNAFMYLIVMTFIMALLVAVVVAIVMSVAVFALTPFLVMVGIPAELLAYMSMATGVLPIMLFFGLLILGVLFKIIWSLWLHLWTYILGARKGVDQTFKSVFYGCTPVYILLWFPFVNIIAIIWGVVLTGMGLKKLHGFTTGKAIAALILAIFIPILILFIIVGIASTMPIGPGLTPVVYQ